MTARDLEAELAAAWAHAHKLNDALQAEKRLLESAAYNGDNLAVWHKSTAFMKDPSFRRAYDRGMQSGHHMSRTGTSSDLHVEWRLHIVIWAAEHAAKLAGDFVECGVNTGMLSLAACDYLDFNNLDRDFWLFDTYSGIPEDQASVEELEHVREINTRNYEDCYDLAQANFAPYPRAHLVRGRVPESLTTVPIHAVSYLSIDLNIAYPERAALEYFWPKLVHGAVVVLDDYGWSIYEQQRVSADEFARSVGVGIATLPTGQGLILKP